MVTFEQARLVVEQQWPDYVVATYGFETDSDWLLVLLPETSGGRVPVVAKRTGVLRWTSTYANDYSEERPIGSLPSPRPA